MLSWTAFEQMASFLSKRIYILQLLQLVLKLWVWKYRKPVTFTQSSALDSLESLARNVLGCPSSSNPDIQVISLQSTLFPVLFCFMFECFEIIIDAGYGNHSSNDCEFCNVVCVVANMFWHQLVAGHFCDTSVGYNKPYCLI